MAALVSIGGFDFPEPSTYNATTSTIVDSGRNVQGRVEGGVAVSKGLCEGCSGCVRGGDTLNISNSIISVLDGFVKRNIFFLCELTVSVVGVIFAHISGQESR